MSKNRKVSKQDNNISDRYKKRYISKNGLDLKNRDNSNKEENKI